MSPCPRNRPGALPVAMREASATQEDLSRALGVSVESIRQWSRRGVPVHRQPAVDRALAAARSIHDRRIPLAQAAAVLGLDVDADGAVLLRAVIAIRQRCAP